MKETDWNPFDEVQEDFFASSIFRELSEAVEAEERFTVTYRIVAASYEEAKERAFAVAVEQTVECPYELVDGTWIADRIVGRIEDLKEKEPGAYVATVSYSPEAVGGEFTEFLNMIFGNTSLTAGVRLLSFTLGRSQYGEFAGPKWGRSGLRNLCGIPNGPILMSVIKPLGTDAKGLARMAYDLARGGCPIIKDDHSLCDQRYAPFTERVTRCVEAVREANAKTGGRTLYVPNATADGTALLHRALEAQELGAGGIMVAPGLTGFSLVRELADAPDFHLPIFLHPSFSGGAVLGRNSGMSPYCYYGQLSRLAGADAVIFTSFGGRFSPSKEDCRLIAAATETDMGPLRPIFPAPAGGMKWQLFPDILKTYGKDTLLLVGGALQTQGPDLYENTKFFMEKLAEATEAQR